MRKKLTPRQRRVQRRLNKLAGKTPNGKNIPVKKKKRPKTPRANEWGLSWIDSFKGTYLDYLESPQWKLRRKLVFYKKGRLCSVCGSKYDLHVHHLSYVNLFHEAMDDLAVLCKGCHENEHEGKDGLAADPMTRRFFEFEF